MTINTSLRYCNWSEPEAHYEVQTHIHRHWEIVIYDGSGISTINNIPYRFVPKSYVIIPSDVPHAEIGEPGRIICIGFDTDLPQDTFPCCYFTDESGVVENLCTQIVSEIKEEPLYYSFRINLLLRDILVQTLRKCGTRQDSPDEKLNMILNYLNAYCATDIDFRALANSLNYSYDYLRHYFKAQMKLSLKQYVIQRRIVLAKEYLMSDLPMAQIASYCGFSSAAHFAATFRQMTNMTPSQFRDNCRKIVTDRNDPIPFQPEDKTE